MALKNSAVHQPPACPLPLGFPLCLQPASGCLPLRASWFLVKDEIRVTLPLFPPCFINRTGKCQRHAGCSSNHLVFELSDGNTPLPSTESGRPHLFFAELQQLPVPAKQDRALHHCFHQEIDFPGGTQSLGLWLVFLLLFGLGFFSIA